jgi:septal ring factor EnvC (AmiA/AmiB activator)
MDSQFTSSTPPLDSKELAESELTELLTRLHAQEFDINPKLTVGAVSEVTGVSPEKVDELLAKIRSEAAQAEFGDRVDQVEAGVKRVETRVKVHSDELSELKARSRKAEQDAEAAQREVERLRKQNAYQPPIFGRNDIFKSYDSKRDQDPKQAFILFLALAALMGFGLYSIVSYQSARFEERSRRLFQSSPSGFPAAPSGIPPEFSRESLNERLNSVPFPSREFVHPNFP